MFHLSFFVSVCPPPLWYSAPNAGQTLTTPHVKDYFSQSHVATFCHVFVVLKEQELRAISAEQWLGTYLIYCSTACALLEVEHMVSCLHQKLFPILLRVCVRAETRLQRCSLSSALMNA